MHAPVTAAPSTAEPIPDEGAKLRVFGAALVGPRAFGVDPKDEPELFVCYEALHRLFNGGRTNRSTVKVILQYVAWGDSSRAPARSKLKNALAALERAALDVIAELPHEARPVRARGLPSVAAAQRSRGTAKVPLVASASLPLAA